MRHSISYVNDPASMGRSHGRKDDYNKSSVSQNLWYSEVSGIEGPRHDSYGYTELTVEFRGHRILWHLGLGEWMIVDGVKVDPIKRELVWDVDEDTGLPYESYMWDPDFEKKCSAAYEKKFVEVMGFTPAQLKRWDDKLKSRCPKCRSKKFESGSGYPGESFLLCAECGNVVDSHFSESAVI